MRTFHSKWISVPTLFAFILSFSPAASARVKEAGASLILPTTGQAMNGQLGNTKTKLMAGIEVAAITTVAVIGFAGGGPAVWFGAGPLIANHLYSSVDAFKNAGGARSQADLSVNQQEMLDAQRNIELSRERRFDREQAYRSDIRERIQRAGEQAGR